MKGCLKFFLVFSVVFLLIMGGTAYAAYRIFFTGEQIDVSVSERYGGGNFCFSVPVRLVGPILNFQEREIDFHALGHIDKRAS